MVARGGGVIINISTMVASFGLNGQAAYGASKAAIELLTKAWTAEYGPEGIRVNAVAPQASRHRADGGGARGDRRHTSSATRSERRANRVGRRLPRIRGGELH